MPFLRLINQEISLNSLQQHLMFSNRIAQILQKTVFNLKEHKVIHQDSSLSTITVIASAH